MDEVSPIHKKPPSSLAQDPHITWESVLLEHIVFYCKDTALHPSMQRASLYHQSDLMIPPFH